MARVGRTILALLTILSTVAFVAVCAAWVRSEVRVDAATLPVWTTFIPGDPASRPPSQAAPPPGTYVIDDSSLYGPPPWVDRWSVRSLHIRVATGTALLFLAPPTLVGHVREQFEHTAERGIEVTRRGDRLLRDMSLAPKEVYNHTLATMPGLVVGIEDDNEAGHFPFVYVRAWWLIAVTAPLPVLQFAIVRRRRSRNIAGRCPRCGYDLRATPTRCPECGAAADTTKPPMSSAVDRG